MTFNKFTYCKPYNAIFLYRYATVDQISIDIERRAVPLGIAELLVVVVIIMISNEFPLSYLNIKYLLAHNEAFSKRNTRARRYAVRALCH